MAKKMPRGLVALSSSAIAAIYLAGFVYTRGADAGLASVATSVAPTTQATATSITTAGATSTAAATSTSTAAATSTSTAAAASTSTVAATSALTATAAPASSATTAAYRDGTYTGSGTSRRGNVSVSLTVQSGRIANVTISSVTTQYPVSRIAALPAQVVSRQSGQVDNVSGATYSAQAFGLAIQAALSKASA